MVGAAEDFAAATASLLPLGQLRHTTSDLLLSGVPLLLLQPPRGVPNNDPAWASRLSRFQNIYRRVPQVDKNVSL